jgi:hypothetical protein
VSIKMTQNELYPASYDEVRRSACAVGGREKHKERDRICGLLCISLSIY